MSRDMNRSVAADCSIATAHAPYAHARALCLAWAMLEVLNVTSRRYTDDVVEHDVDLTLAGCPDAAVTTVRVHSRVDAWTGAVIVDAQRVIARAAADAPEATACDEELSTDQQMVIESHPELVKIVEREMSARKVA